MKLECGELLFGNAKEISGDRLFKRMEETASGSTC